MHKHVGYCIYMCIVYERKYKPDQPQPGRLIHLHFCISGLRKVMFVSTCNNNIITLLLSTQKQNDVNTPCFSDVQTQKLRILCTLIASNYTCLMTTKMNEK